jgi:hypothetical protein
MNLIRTYQSHLASRATGLSRLGWYVASAREGAPWVLGIFVATILASFAPEPNRLLAMSVAFVPGFIGWAASQIYMGVIHMRDLRAETTRQPR